jgi:hypothetical protein
MPSASVIDWMSAKLDLQVARRRALVACGTSDTAFHPTELMR